MLASLTEYKVYKNIRSSEQDVRLTNMLLAASSTIVNYCGREFTKHYNLSKIEYFYETEEYSEIFLTEIPIREVESIEVTVDNGATYEIVDPTYYYLDKRLDIIKFISSVKGFLKVTYKGGYEYCPEDLKLATMDLASYHYNEEYNPKKILGSAHLETSTVLSVDSAKMPPHIRRTLALYRLKL